MKNLTLCAVLVANFACGVLHADTLQLEGSTTVGPIADAFAEYFKSIYPDLQITVKKTGSVPVEDKNPNVSTRVAKTRSLVLAERLCAKRKSCL